MEPESVDFPVAADTYTKQADPTVNYGSSSKIQIRSTGSSFARTPYLKFNVSGLTDSVQGAVLYVYSTSLNSPVTALSVPNNNWTETEITYANAPPTGAVIGTGTASAGDWFSIDLTASGFITGNGTYSIALDESNNALAELASREGGNNGAYLRISIPSAGGNNAPVFTADPIVKPDATQNVLYSDTIAGSATDVDNDPLSYQILSGPDWITMSSDGDFSGTPTVAGTDTFTVEVSDGNGGTDTATLQITVDPAGDPLPGLAADPNPVHRARDISLNPTLIWTAGTDVVSHNVYFGTDAANLPFQGNQSGTTFAPGSLSNKTTYYWRVDEVNDTGTTTGDVWQFKTVR
jgi:hypothetical protein